jgi:hypothetical protein
MRFSALCVLLSVLSCGGVSERDTDGAGTGASSGSVAVSPSSGLGEGGAPFGNEGTAGEGGSSPYGWSCDPRFPEPTGVCRCPNDLCRCDGAMACAPECADGVTIEQICISLDDIYLTACRCSDSNGGS